MLDNSVETVCPYCAETILIAAKKCKHCGEIIDTHMRELNHLKNMQMPSNVIVNSASTASSAGITENSNRLALWNPVAAVNWSILFTPILGAWIHAKNWKELGEKDKAKRSMYWVYGTTLLLLITLFSNVGIVGLPILFWYFISAREQIKYFKEKVGNNYTRKDWGMPLSISIGAVVVVSIIRSF
jgi:hypothetical protein